MIDSLRCEPSAESKRSMFRRPWSECRTCDMEPISVWMLRVGLLGPSIKVGKPVGVVETDRTSSSGCSECAMIPRQA